MSLKRNVVANYLGQGWSALMALAFVPVYVGYVGIEGYGVIGLFAVIHAWLALLDMGMAPTLMREMARYRANSRGAQSTWDLLRTLEVLGAGIALSVIGAIALASGWLATHWLNPRALTTETVQVALALAGVMIGMRFPEGLYRSAIFGLEHQVWINAASATVSTVRAVGAVGVLAFVSPSIEAYAAWHSAMAAVPVLIYRWKLVRVLPRPSSPPQFSLAALSEVRHFATGMMATSITVLILTQIDKALLARLLPLEDFGYYTLAAAVAGGLMMLIGPIVAAVYPRMVAVAGTSDLAPLAAVFHAAAQFASVAVVPIALVLAVFPKGALFAWSADIQLAVHAGPLMALLVLGTALNGVMQVPAHLQLAYGRTGLAFKVNLVAIALLVPAILLFVPSNGAIAAAWIWLALNAGYVVLAAPLIFRGTLTREQRGWYLHDLLRPTLGAAAAILLAAPFKPAGYVSRAQWLAYLAICTAAAMAGAMAGAPLVRARLRPSWRAVWGT